MKSRSFRVVALTIATVTALVGSVPMVTSAADEAVEIASRTSVTANDVQVAKRKPTINVVGRAGSTINVTGRAASTINVSGRTLSIAGLG